MHLARMTVHGRCRIAHKAAVDDSADQEFESVDSPMAWAKLRLRAPFPNRFAAAPAAHATPNRSSNPRAKPETLPLLAWRTPCPVEQQP